MTSPNIAAAHVAPSQNNKTVTQNQATDDLDNAMNSILDFDTTAGGSLSLTSDQFNRNAVINLTGTGGGAAFTLNVPANARFFVISNNSGQTATIQVTGGLGISVDVATATVIALHSDATDVISIGAAGGGSSITKATTSEVLDGTADVYIDPANARAALAFVSLTDGANISWDMDTGINFDVTLGGDRTLDNPTSISEGSGGVFQVIQDGTGTRLISTWGTYYKFSGGTAPTLSTGIGAVDTFSWFARSATEIYIAEVGSFS